MAVVGPPPQPAIPRDAIVAIRIVLPTVNKSFRSFRFLAPRRGSTRNAARAPAIVIGCCKGDRRADREFSDARVAEVAFTSVAMVSVDVAIPETVGVIFGEEKVQVVFFGSPLHVRVVAALKPLTDVTVMVIAAGVPALKEPLPGESAIVKFGGPGQTATATLLETEAALLVSPA